MRSVALFPPLRCALGASCRCRLHGAFVCFPSVLLVHARGPALHLGVCLMRFPAVACAFTPIPTIASLVTHMRTQERTASLQSTGAQSTGSQVQVQYQDAKSTQYRDDQLPYCTQSEQQCDQRLPCSSPHRGPQPLATRRPRRNALLQFTPEPLLHTQVRSEYLCVPEYPVSLSQLMPGPSTLLPPHGNPTMGYRSTAMIASTETR